MRRGNLLQVTLHMPPRDNKMLYRIATLVVLASLLAVPADADWFGKRKRKTRAKAARTSPPVPNGYKTPYPTRTGPMSIGFFSYPNYNYPKPGSFDPYRFDNYVHYPYELGRFDAPDLLNDPYFRERHRYDSHFQGRRYSR